MFFMKSTNYESWAWYPQVFNLQETKNIIALKDKFGSDKGLVGGATKFDVNESIRKSNISWLSYCEETDWIYQRLSTAINQMNNQFFGFDLTAMQTLQLTEYDSSYEGHYHQHSDILGKIDGGYQRKLSIVVQLSDPDTYKGGDLLLYPNNLKDPQKAPKDLGTMTLFRSHVIHEATTVTEGIRYSLVCWVEGPPFK